MFYIQNLNQFCSMFLNSSHGLLSYWVCPRSGGETTSAHTIFLHGYLTPLHGILCTRVSLFIQTSAAIDSF